MQITIKLKLSSLLLLIIFIIQLIQSHKIGQFVGQLSRSYNLGVQEQSKHLYRYGSSRLLIDTAQTINYIQNGVFTNTSCQFDQCSLSKSDDLPNWIFSSIQIVRASYWSSQISQFNYVVNLVNLSSIYQTIAQLPTGNFSLNYGYKVYETTPLSKGGFQVYYNNLLIKTVIPTSINYIVESIIVQRNTAFQAAEIKFVSSYQNQGSLLSYGVAIVKVQFIQTYDNTLYYDYTQGNWANCMAKFILCAKCNQISCLTCMDNSFNDTSVNQCKLCSEIHGQTCLQCNNTSCYSCSNGITDSTGRCCLSSQQYYNVTSKSCENCNQKFTDSSSCTNLVCLSCINQTYIIYKMVCTSCETLYPYCQTCNLYDCIECLANYTNYQGKCCAEDQYYNQELYICVNCDAYQNCKKCNKYQCLQCRDITVYSPNNIVCQFAQGLTQFSMADNFNLVVGFGCQDWLADCEICDYDRCFQCYNLTLSSGHCCQITQYYDMNAANSVTCSQLQPNCSRCDRKSCFQCEIGVFNQGKCCQIYEFYNNQSGFCIKCDIKFQNCATCTINQCLTCLTGDIKYKCDTIIYLSNGQIYEMFICPSKCVTCYQGSCSKCQDTYFLFLNTCKQISNDTSVRELGLRTMNLANSTFSNPVMSFIIQNVIVKTILNSLCNFFSALDDLWMFSYHERDYTLTVASLLDSVRQIQSNKFNPLGEVQQISQTIQSVQSNFNNYTYFGKPKYITIEHVSSGFYQSTVSFFIVTIPQTILTFIVSRLIFSIFFNYRISKFFRQYTFNAYFAFSLLDGNMQFFTYLCSNQFQTFFSANYIQKVQNFVFLIFGAGYIQASFTSYLLLIYFYRNNSNYFLANNKESFYGSFSLVVYQSFRNVFLAAIASFSSNNYILLIWLLNAVQLIFIVTILFLFVKFKCFKNKQIFWISLVFACIRLILQLSFAILNNKIQSTDLQQQVQSFIFLTYLIFWVTTIVFFIMKVIYNCFLKLVYFIKGNQNVTVKEPQVNLFQSRDRQVKNMFKNQIQSSSSIQNVIQIPRQRKRFNRFINQKQKKIEDNITGTKKQTQKQQDLRTIKQTQIDLQNDQFNENINYKQTNLNLSQQSQIRQQSKRVRQRQRLHFKIIDLNVEDQNQYN